MTALRRGISEKPRKANAQRQASSWRGNVITLLLLTGVTGLVSWMYFTWTDDLTHTLDSRSEILTQPRVFTVECSEDYKKYKLFPGMHPFIEDHSLNTAVFTGNYYYYLYMHKYMYILLLFHRLAEWGLSLAGSDDGASILDLHSGALSMGKQFVNIYSGNRTVEPRAGRVSFFSSGSENLHHVEKVPWGTRYAITVSFTCDPDYAIDNPSLL
uniref:Urotensin-2 receptor 2 n=1 Tax=Sinocyclocheilus grahami TaxID=75366 RepID=A0A672LUJ1_SINGR